jgi:ribonuclease HI
MISVVICNKNELNDEIWRRLAREREEKYKNACILYTDGSKREERVAWAVSTKDTVIDSARLSDHSSVFSAEMTAIIAATRVQTIERTIVIMSDSLSSISAVEERKEMNDSTRLFYNQIPRDKNIVLVWIPSHKGIAGNEVADVGAKSALLSELDSNIHNRPKFTTKDAVAYIKKHIKDKVEQQWKRVYNNKLRMIKDNIERGPLSNQLTRAEQKKITRLRLGHTLLTHKHIFEREPAIKCQTCKIELTIEHIFNFCHNYRSFLSQLNLNLHSLMKAEDHKKIIEFLKETNLYNEL